MVAQTQTFEKGNTPLLVVSMLFLSRGKRTTSPPGTCEAACKAFWKSVIPNSHKTEPFLGRFIQDLGMALGKPTVNVKAQISLNGWTIPLQPTPRKINIEPENDGLEDEFPFPGVYSQVPC